MKKYGKYFGYSLCFFVMACHSTAENQQKEASVSTVPEEIVMEVQTEPYRHQQTTISIISRSVNDLLKDHKLGNDSVYEHYKKQLSKHSYFVLRLEKDRDAIADISLNIEDLKSHSCMVNCGDTLQLEEISVLHDFGLSKTKQMLLVFPQQATKCDERKILIRGLFNRFDLYEFEVLEK